MKQAGAVGLRETGRADATPGRSLMSLQLQMSLSRSNVNQCDELRFILLTAACSHPARHVFLFFTSCNVWFAKARPCLPQGITPLSLHLSLLLATPAVGNR